MSEVKTSSRTATSVTSEKDFGSSSEEDGYLSPYNGSEDGSVPFNAADDGSLMDELPPFSAFTLSPSARSLSPIELESFESSAHSTPHARREYIGCSTPVYNTPPAMPHHDDTRNPKEGFISLDEIHARIGLTPPDVNGSRSRLNLETIFEGVFLETPPKKEFQSKGNLLRRSIKNRALQYEKSEEKENIA